jgi:hypothetical protein
MLYQASELVNLVALPFTHNFKITSAGSVFLWTTIQTIFMTRTYNESLFLIPLKSKRHSYVVICLSERQ